MSESTLLINQLPDDCLLKIFYLICDLPDLIHCYQVCQKWNQLISHRARKAKYLLVGWSQLRTWKYSFAPEPKVPKDSIYYEGKFKFPEIDLADLFTKIKILDLFFLDNSDPGLKTLVNFINNSESLKGLICKRDMLHELSINCQHIEMLATDGLNDYYTNQGYGAKLSQLSLFEVVFTDFALNIKHFPGLRRLHLKTYSHDQRESNGPYPGPELKHLEILELLTWVGNLHVYYGFQFMDHCPSLKSAFITIEFVADVFINKNILNYNLQDLVITLMELISKYCPLYWSSIQTSSILGYFYMAQREVKSRNIILLNCLTFYPN
ncbi:uncharacterized protein LOC107370872 isoform X2 [Tetranychus urticae]|uniref:uncharacterized protein LOC107370872 isoform X2 n=1 Tax=Tetranychus urticae TaxID=32264 RepID=UPI00077B866F|nr:uncharacterized protein LOC107370872 isoform X2 [Tetranychus urticae]